MGKSDVPIHHIVLLHGARCTKEEWKTSGIIASFQSSFPSIAVTAIDLPIAYCTPFYLMKVLTQLESKKVIRLPLSALITPSASGQVITKWVCNLPDELDSNTDSDDDDTDDNESSDDGDSEEEEDDDDANGESAQSRSKLLLKLRYAIGQSVECKTGPEDGDWEKGIITKLNYIEKMNVNNSNSSTVPYQVRLINDDEDGNNDDDNENEDEKQDENKDDSSKNSAGS